MELSDKKYKHILYANMPVDECVNRLNRAFVKRSDWPGFFMPAGGILGDVKGRKFRIAKNNRYRNSWSPIFYGEFAEEGKNTRILGNFRLHPFVKGFTIFWFTGILFFLVLLLFLSKGNIEGIGLGIIAVMLLGGFGLVWFGTRLGNKERKYVLDYLGDLFSTSAQTVGDFKYSSSGYEAAKPSLLDMKIVLPRKINFLYIIAVIWGIPIIAFSLFNFYSRMNIEVKGEVIAAEVHRNEEYGNISYTDYQILQGDGTVIRYRASANDPALSREIPVGTKLVKNRWELSYTLDGREVKDFPIGAYSIELIVGIVLFVGGLFGGFIINKRIQRQA